MHLLPLVLVGLAFAAGNTATGPAGGSSKERLAAVVELAERGDLRSLELLSAAARHDGDPAVREEAIQGLGEAGDAGFLPVLEDALADPERRVRRAAVEAAADVGGDGAAWVLAAALRDGDDLLREDAVYALGEIGGDVAVVVLEQALVDERPFVREAAAEVLEELTGRRNARH